jgi:hypothetical protein
MVGSETQREQPAPAKRPLSHFATECSGMNSANIALPECLRYDRMRRVYPANSRCFRCYCCCKLDTTARIASDFNMDHLCAAQESEF